MGAALPPIAIALSAQREAERRNRQRYSIDWSKSGMFRSQRHNKISRQMPEKECFSLSVFCASHHPDALLVSHLDTRT